MNAWRGAALLGTAALFAAALLGLVYQLTREPIAEAERRAERQALATVLPPSRYDNDPSADRIEVVAPGWLGSGAPMTVRRARRDGEPVALLIEAVAPDGYSGDIHLLAGVGADGRFTGVRITRHQETPGLGDRIEAARSDWIERFRGLGLGEPPIDQWKVRKDGGAFDQFAGATITPRAVVAALARLLQYVDEHGEALYEAPAGTRIEHHDAPELPQHPRARPE